MVELVSWSADAVANACPETKEGYQALLNSSLDLDLMSASGSGPSRACCSSALTLSLTHTGETALNVAVSKGRREMVCILLNSGASPLVANTPAPDRSVQRCVPLGAGERALSLHVRTCRVR